MVWLRNNRIFGDCLQAKFHYFTFITDNSERRIFVRRGHNLFANKIRTVAQSVRALGRLVRRSLVQVQPVQAWDATLTHKPLTYLPFLCVWQSYTQIINSNGRIGKHFQNRVRFPDDLLENTNKICWRAYGVLSKNFLYHRVLIKSLDMMSIIGLCINFLLFLYKKDIYNSSFYNFPKSVGYENASFLIVKCIQILVISIFFYLWIF